MNSCYSCQQQCSPIRSSCLLKTASKNMLQKTRGGYFNHINLSHHTQSDPQTVLSSTLMHTLPETVLSLSCFHLYIYVLHFYLLCKAQPTNNIFGYSPDNLLISLSSCGSFPWHHVAPPQLKSSFFLFSCRCLFHWSLFCELQRFSTFGQMQGTVECKACQSPSMYIITTLPDNFKSRFFSVKRKKHYIVVLRTFIIYSPLDL